ncbi:MAG: hypothetical protein AB8B57_06030 [Congregibacter sp.]
MNETAGSGGFLRSIGESVGSFLAGIPPAIGEFFGGVGQGAGVNGILDWTALILGLALLLSTIRGFKRGRIVGPMFRGMIGVAIMGWAIA